MKKHLEQTIITTMSLGVIMLSSYAFSNILGSTKAYFGISNILLPALTYATGIAGNILGLCYVGIKMGTGKILVTKGLPTLAALWSIQTRSSYWKAKLINIVVPVAAMIAFVLHPTGAAAYSYTFFWLIPITAELMKSKNNNLFLDQLIATFVAHAVGSVIWLYTIPTTPATWTSLLTIVPVERIIFASGATLSVMALHKITNVILLATKSKIETCK